MLDKNFTVKIAVCDDEDAQRNRIIELIKKEKDKFLTRKTKGDHGIGISSMQEICQKNDILMKIAYTDDTFDVLFVF